MGFTKTTRQITVTTLTGDGAGGFWWTALDSNTNLYQLNYEGGTGVIERAGDLQARSTFKQVINAMIAGNVGLPAGDAKIDVEGATEREGLMPQFEDPELLDADLVALDAAYDLPEFLQKLSIFPLVRRCYVLGLLTVQELGQTILYMLERGRITAAKAIAVADRLLSDGDITQAQYNNFITLVNNTNS